MTEPVLSARGIHKAYRQGPQEVMALAGVDLDVRRGEFVAITGSSGSGKSTLLHILGGLDEPDAGSVTLEGVELATLDAAGKALVRRRQVGLVLQFFNLLPTLDAAENAAFPLLLDGAPDALEKGRARLERVGLSERAAHRPAQLSGGEQQRVALARALVMDPAVVLADEPTGNLDSETGASILSLLRSTADDGQTIVMVTHDRAAAEYADRVVRLKDGRLT